MSWLRRLVLPTVVATPLWLWIAPVSLRGPQALGDFRPPLADLLFAAFFTLAGLLLIGLPSSAFVIRRRWPAAIKAASLLVAGAAGGCLVAMLYVLLILLSPDGAGLASVGVLPGFALLGALPGLVVAAVWAAINFDALMLRTQGNENA